eukprot:SAG11_NODE_1319_length_5209_cov_10.314873_3_plen_127_part_00
MNALNLLWYAAAARRGWAMGPAGSVATDPVLSVTRTDGGAVDASPRWELGATGALYRLLPVGGKSAAAGLEIWQPSRESSEDNGGLDREVRAPCLMEVRLRSPWSPLEAFGVCLALLVARGPAQRS